MGKLTTIGFDADDTLWQNQSFYNLTEERFAALLADYADPQLLGKRLLEVERRSLKLYGFGIKGFILSMVETALEVTEERVPGSVIAQILDIGREMLAHPVEILPDVVETIGGLKDRYRLVMITKGDLFDQERKIASSGLADEFHSIEIVSDKTEETYRRIFSRYDGGPAEALMIGNSLKSDVVPALLSGAWGIYLPHDLNWAFEHDDEPTYQPRYRKISRMSELAALIDEIHTEY